MFECLRWRYEDAAGRLGGRAGVGVAVVMKRVRGRDRGLIESSVDVLVERLGGYLQNVLTLHVLPLGPYLPLEDRSTYYPDLEANPSVERVGMIVSKTTVT